MIEIYLHNGWIYNFQLFDNIIYVGVKSGYIKKKDISDKNRCGVVQRMS